MNLELITTDDGSNTLFSSEYNDHYHSTRGAISEAKHIYIDSGLKKVSNFKKTLTILEVGYGTGLNALCTLDFATKNNLKINYIGVEMNPISISEIKKLNYSQFFDNNIIEQYFNMHTLPKNYPHYINDNFIFNFIEAKYEDIELRESSFDLVFYDPFKHETNMELWTKDMFSKTYNSIKANGFLLTYCSKSIVRKAMQESGFEIEKIDGPDGKREIVRATKEIIIDSCKKHCKN